MRIELRLLLVCIASALPLLGCSEKSFDEKKQLNQAPQAAEPLRDLSFEPAAPSIGASIDQKPIEEVLCSEAPKLLSSVQKESFLEQLAFVCNGKNTTQAFAQLIKNAYSGQGNPQPEIWKKSVGDLYVTEMVLAYALKVPLENPALFADLKAHDAFAKGISQDKSFLQLDVLQRTPFPGRKSIEKVVLSYNLTNADGAGIYDKRKTEFNTYTILENRRDVIVASEELLEAESNQSYHKAQGLLVGVKGTDGHSYLVFINQLVIKNRIDPDRLERTLISLNKGAAQILNRLITNSL